MEHGLLDGKSLLDGKRSRVHIVVTYLLIISFAIIGTFYLLFGLTEVTGESMENTIFDGNQVFLLKHGYSLERGDIVTFNVGSKKEPHDLIKRVIAVSGDKVLYVRDKSKAYVDLYLCKSGDTAFRYVDEPYIKERMRYSFFSQYRINVLNDVDRKTIESIDITKSANGYTETVRQAIIDAAINVPQKHFYFLGDNRNVSRDSRHYGTRNYSCIYGKMLINVIKDSKEYKILNFIF